MLLSIVIPAYNEARFLPEILRRVREAPYDKEIIVVDDASVDGTRKCLQELNDGDIKVIFHEKNAGKGAAVRSGIKIASGDIVIIQDADLEYDPKDYPKLLEPILAGNADVVYGSRFLGGPHRVFYFKHYVGNQIVTLLSNILSDLNLSDVETGYKAFARKVFDEITIESNRFGFEPEVTAKIAKKGYRVYEVPVSYHGRSYSEGKKVTWKDGIKALFTIVKYNLFR